MVVAASHALWNSGVGMLSYTIRDDAGWLSTRPSSGNTGEVDRITVSLWGAALTFGTCQTC